MGTLAVRKAACSLSHLRLWHELAHLPDPAQWFLSLEDDAVLDAAAVQGTIALLGQLASYAWDVAILEQHPPEKPTWDAYGLRAGDNLQLMKHGVYGNTAYLLTVRGARKLLQCGLPLSRWQDLVVKMLAHTTLCMFTPVVPLVMSVGVFGGMPQNSTGKLKSSITGG